MREYNNRQVERDARTARLCLIFGAVITALSWGAIPLWRYGINFGGNVSLLGILLIVIGANLNGLVKRYYRYAELFMRDDNPSLIAIAAKSGRPFSKFMRDIAKMTRRGYFPPGGFGDWTKADEPPVEAPAPETPASAIVDQGRAFIARFAVIEAAEENGETRAKIRAIRQTAAQIFEFVDENPDYAPKLAKFMEYQLPEAVKLLNTYRSVTGKAVVVEQMQSAANAVLGALDSMNAAMQAQLNALYQDMALNTKADADVYKNFAGAAHSDFGGREN